MKNNLDLVTVIIPSYNHAEYIEDCLDSIAKDNYQNLEVDIIDDGSTDGSVEIIRSWQQNNPKINLRLDIQENKGQNFTLNKLIKNANGEYICLLASDDSLYFGGILKRVNFFKKHPNKYAVIGDAKVVNHKNEVIFESAIEDLYNGNKENLKSDDKLRYSIINEFSIPGPVLLVKKSLYDKIGPYPAIFAEDIYFYLKVIGLGLLIYLDEPVAYYRKHENNTGGNLKYAKELNRTFIISYWLNMKYYKGRLKLQLLKKLLGRIYNVIKIYFRNNLKKSKI